jgi:hypothetical protein
VNLELTVWASPDIPHLNEGGYPLDPRRRRKTWIVALSMR